MTPKRKKVQEYILNHIKKIDQTKTNDNYNRYKELFDKMSDKDFDDYMHRLKNGDENIYYINCTMRDNVDVTTLINYAKEVGVKLFEKVKLWDNVTNTQYLTPNEAMILQLPVRRVSQFIDHKLSVPEGDSKIDLLSGQVVKPDQAASLSQIETQTLYTRGLENTIIELIKYRGGDVVAFGEYKRELEETGQTTVGRDTGSVARSAVVMGVYFNGMHIETNFTEI